MSHLVAFDDGIYTISNQLFCFRLLDTSSTQLTEVRVKYYHKRFLCIECVELAIVVIPRIAVLLLDKQQQ